MALGLVAGCAVVGCTVDDPPGTRCASEDDCVSRECVFPEGLEEGELGFCVGGDAPDGGEMDAGDADAGPRVDACAPSTRPDPCGGGDEDCDGRTDEDADLTQSPNCNRCGAVCEGDTPMCVAGVGCRAAGSCSGGTLAECPMDSGICVDTASTTAHCGACGFACHPGEACRDGNCRCGDGELDCSDPTGTCCGGACVDTENDEANCGGCDRPCPSRTECVNGRCQCGGGGDCRPPFNCTALGVCLI